MDGGGRRGYVGIHNFRKSTELANAAELFRWAKVTKKGLQAHFN